MIGLAIIIVLLVLLLPQALFIVPQQNVYIIERLGKFNCTVGAGLNIKIPFFETIAAKVDMRTRQEQFGIDAKTRDNVTVTMAIAAQYRVSAQPAANGQPSGVWRSYYMLANPTAQMRSYLIDALRSSVPQYTLDEVFDKKDAIASDVNQTVSGLMVAYGYDVVSTLITSIDLPADVEQSMNRINSAQRERRPPSRWPRQRAHQGGHRGPRPCRAMEQAGRGIAAQRKAIADGISESLAVIKSSGVSAAEANQLFIFTQWTDMMSEFARNGRQSTVVLPSDFSATASMFEQMLVAQETEGADEFVIVEEEGEVAPLSRRFELPCAVRGLSQKGAIISLAPRYGGDILSNRVQTRNDARPFRSIEVGKGNGYHSLLSSSRSNRVSPGVHVGDNVKVHIASPRATASVSRFRGRRHPPSGRVSARPPCARSASPSAWSAPSRAFPEDREDRGHPGRCAPCQAVLPAQQGGQGRRIKRKAFR